MSHNPRFTLDSSIKNIYTLTRDPQNAYVTNLTDGTLTQTRSYNSFGEVTEVSDNTFSYQLPSRDQSGAIVQKKETLNGATETFDYTYDEMGRLTQACRVGLPSHQGCETYTYDNNGNRASATVNGTSITASYTLDDNLVVYGDNSYLYDDDGYLKEKTTPQGTTTYTYGTRGELLSVTTPTKTITYKHNALNQRVAKLVNGQVVEKYLWKDLTTLLAIYDKDDNLKQRFEYADSRMPVAMTSNGQKYYLHYDQVGSLRAITDTNHNIVKEIVYDTFGNVLSDSNPSFTVPFGFAGGLYDQDTKLTRFGYRDYDAYTGKWTAKDPIGFSGGDSNLYGYVLGDPVGFVDPSGLVDENLIPTDTWMNQYLHNTMDTFNTSNAYSIATHGFGGWFSGNINNLADNAKNSGKSEILLIACQQGDGEMGNMAQDLANLSNMPVQYTTGNVNAIPFIGPFTFYPHTWHYIYPRLNK